MATERKVSIPIETTATGDGAKKTSEEIKSLEAKTKTARTTSRQLRQELAKMDDVSEDVAKQINQTADAFATMATRGNRAIERMKAIARQEVKVGYASKDLGNGIYSAQKRVDDLGLSVDKTGNKLKNLEERQKRANQTAEQSATAHGKAAKGKRHLGLAALEASRAIEDMQYGVRGVLNNIPQLILMLGGGAGLTAVISILAVGLTQLSERFGKTTDKIKEQAETVDVSEYKKRAAREASQEQLDEYQKKLDALVGKHAEEREEINRTTASLIANQEARLRIEDATLRRDILLIENDDSLTAVEKAEQVMLKRLEHAEMHRQIKEESLAIQLDNNLQTEQSLESEIKLRKELEAQYRSLKAERAELLKPIPGLKKVAHSVEQSLPGQAQKISDFIGSGKLKPPNSLPAWIPGAGTGAPEFRGGDAKGSKAYVDQAFDFLTERRESIETAVSHRPDKTATPGQEYVLENIDEGLKVISQFYKAANAAENGLAKAEKLEKEASQINKEASSVKTEADKITGTQKELDQLRAKNKQLENELEVTRQENDLNRQADYLSSASTVKQAAKSGYTSTTADLVQDVTTKVSEAGASQEELKELAEAGSKLKSEAARAVKDGQIDLEEQAKHNKALEDFVRTAGGRDQAMFQVLQNYGGQIRTLTKQLNTMSQQQAEMSGRQYSP